MGGGKNTHTMVTNTKIGTLQYRIVANLKRLKRSFFFRLIRLCQMQEEWYLVPPFPPRPTPDTQKALNLPAAALVAPTTSQALADHLSYQQDMINPPEVRDLFSIDGIALPC